MKITSMFLVSSEILLLFVAIGQGLSGTKIILDVTKLIKDAIQEGLEQNKAHAALDTVIKENELTSMLYYEADFHQNITTEVNDVLTIFRNKSSRSLGSKIMFSIKDVHGLMGLQNMKLFYNDLTDLLLNHTTIVAGISYHAYYLDSSCGYHSVTFESHHPTTSIIPNMQKYILEFNQKLFLNLSLNLGYELDVTYLKCPDHQRNIQLADYLIVNVPFSRTDDGFVESYGLLKNMLDNEIMPAVLKSYGKTNLFTKVSVTKTVSREPWLAFYHIGRGSGERIYYPYQTELLNFAKDHLETLDNNIFPKYAHLLTQYMHQWVFDNKHNNYSIILSYNPAFSDNRLVNGTKNNIFMPLVSFPFIPEESRLAVEILLRDVKANGFTSLMLSAEEWQSVHKTISSRRSDLTNTNSSKSIKVFYYLENKEQFDKIKNNLANIHGSGEINVGTIVFASEIQFYNKRNWEAELWNSVGSKQIVTLACQISTDNLDTLDKNDICDNPICCEALNIRTSTNYNCKYHNSKSTTVIWSKTLNFTELDGTRHRTQDLIKTTKKILDTFLIAREIFKKYENNEIIIHLKSIYKADLSWNGGTTMYCNIYAETISQLYDVILTWAEIYEFPIFLEPSGEKYRYDHPLVWNQLEVSNTNPMHNLMNKIPLYIRRKYITSKIFGWWNDGMYPCIQKATTKNTKYIQSNAFYNAGVTLRMDLRQGNLSITAQEFQVLLLLSLCKFSEVEIQITEAQHITILKEIVRIPEFRENVKSNQIFGKTIHLEIFDTVCSKIDNSVFNEIISALTLAGLKVKISAENFECVRNLKSEVTQVDEIGLVVGNCLREAEKIVQSPSLHKSKTNLSQVFYIVCATDKALAHNSVAKEMQDFLDSHLYFKKLFQYFYPNLKEIHFRLQPLLIKKVNTVSDLIMFLTDVNNYAIGYGMKYFLLQAFARETNYKIESSFWTISNYSNLTDMTVYRDLLAEYLKQPTWVPIVFTQNDNKSEIENENTTLQIGGMTTKNEETSTEIFSISTSTVSTPFHIIVLGIVACIIFVASIIATYILWYKKLRPIQKLVNFLRYGRQQRTTQAVPQPPQSYELQDTSKKSNNRYQENDFQTLKMKHEAYSEQQISKYELTNGEISIDEENILGKGQFGIVFRGKLTNNGSSIAVKRFHDASSNSGLKSMINELKLLCKIGEHENVVKFVGYCISATESGVLLIIMELCDGGSLISLLRSKRQVGMSEDFSVQTLLRFCREIAQGMEYISSKKILHGDLAARNVLLDNKQTCKIGDFGLSRQLYEYTEYVKTSQEPLPWRWMAYESLCLREFSTQSDVWMYGVTVWEIFSLGTIPFPTISWNQAFVDEIEQGLRPSCPQLAKPEIYTMMSACWSLNTMDRPSFSDIIQELNKIKC